MEEVKKFKVYIDSNLIFSPEKIKNLKEKEAKALEEILDNYGHNLSFCTSEKTKEEIERLKDIKKRVYLKFIYFVLLHVSRQNIIEFIPATFGSVCFGSATFGGGVGVENHLFTKLKQFFEQDDAEQIFQAEKNNCDYFLTLDEKTILAPTKEKRNEFEKLGLKIKIVSPTGLLSDLRKLGL
jgi:hypothetical protein